MYCDSCAKLIEENRQLREALEKIKQEIPTCTPWDDFEEEWAIVANLVDAALSQPGAQFAEELAAKQIDLPPEVGKAVSEHFWELFEPVDAQPGEVEALKGEGASE